MSEAELYRSISKVTGEEINRLRRMGFMVVTIPKPREVKVTESKCLVKRNVC